MSVSFQFKQFKIKQDQCAMKIGTDGVVLGAWVLPEYEPRNILDIGTGTGVISLMLAQRFNASEIEAIEIDEKAYEQSVSNFEASPWGDRLFGYHASFQEYFQEVDDEKYDLIISNPPYFLPTQKTQNNARNIARFEDALPFEHLLYGASKLLDEKGVFALIIPYSIEEKVIKTASDVYLFPERITRVRGNAESIVKRSLIQFKFTVEKQNISELILEKERHVFTQEYTKLVKDFYLKL